ncbi:hypothetical protein DdX_10829 [Ditylenchus destructor]|uniref:MULE transposase domain-containing protein n=1 Tax=Ditylenchus destructor TaxID=166010 RepID=A0AAD4QYT2_9BILA|nr:hypothetical protein DdX_10829 [Ditylenchus destructor]
MFDCEPASFQTFATVFPGVSPHLCAFHVKQALNERIGKIGLQCPYRENACVQKCVRMIGALQLIDKDLWDTACSVIEEHIDLVFVDSPHKDTLFDLLTYFRDQWFKYGAYFSLWKLDKDAPRTNNACEIYHAHTQRYFTPGAYLGQWVHQFRVVQNAEQNYCMDLLRGKPVKHRFAAFYAGLADQLDQCKEELKSAILDASGEIFLRGQISRFLSRTGKLLGIKPATVERVQNVSLVSESERESDDDIGSQTPIEIRDMSDLAELDSFLSA